jgi:formate hydrogenlyase subunit 4
MGMDLQNIGLNSVLQALLLLVAAPLLQGIIQTTKARLQNRRGPTPLQPFWNLSKLLGKNETVSSTASWISTVTPFFCFSAAFAALVLVAPQGGAGFIPADTLLIVYLFAFSRFFLSLAGLDAGSAFGGMGASREMFLSVLVEPAFLFALIAVAGSVGTTALVPIVDEASRAPFSLPFALACGAFLFVAVAECGRIPVDNPDTHLELTMFQEGTFIEYSGRSLALLQWAAYARQTVMLVLLASVFFPWTWQDLVPSFVVWTSLKIVAGSLLLAILETATAKMRVFRLPEFLAASGLLSMLALIAR